jgi:hypothetical protein
MLRWTALLIITLLLAAPAMAEVRLALIIAQSEYDDRYSLPKVDLAPAEADMIEQSLRETGFQAANITRVENVTTAQLREALNAFRVKLDRAGPQAIGFVYYTGHGAQHPVSRESYLLGKEAQLQVDSDLVVYGVSIESQSEAFGATRAKAVIMVFDACRNIASESPYKTAYKGLGRAEAAANMLIAYSAGLNKTAKAGVYAPILAEEMRIPGQTLFTLFGNVQTRVAEATQEEPDRQVPWFDPKLSQKLCFAGCEAPAASIPASSVAAASRPVIPAGPSEAELSRARVFCDGLRQASDAVISGKRPGFKLRSGEDSWDGDVPGYRLRLGELIAPGRYTYLMQQYELWFFLSGASTGEIRETLNLCPSVAKNVSGNAEDGVFFSGRSSGVQKDVYIHVSSVDRTYNEATRAFESGVNISLELVNGQ